MQAGFGGAQRDADGRRHLGQRHELMETVGDDCPATGDLVVVGSRRTADFIVASA